MYFITTKRMLEVCFFQHTPTFIIEPFLCAAGRTSKKSGRNNSRPICLQLEFLIFQDK